MSKSAVASILFLGAAFTFNGVAQLWATYQHWQQLDRICAISAAFGKDACK